MADDRRKRPRFKKSQIGKLIAVSWLDPVGFVQARLSEVKPCVCVTQGVLLRIEDDFVVVASSQYAEDDEDRVVDATAITKGCVQKIAEL